MKRVRVGLVVALLLAVGVGAQNAKVIQIDRDDARDAKAKWEALQKAQADWDAVAERVKKDYVYVSKSSQECGSQFMNVDYCYRKGWENNFDFSTDFKFIVPKPQPQYSGCNGTSWNGNCGYIFSGATVPTSTFTTNSAIGVIQ